MRFYTLCGLLVVLACAGCAKSPQALRQQEAEVLQASVQAALESGKSVVLCRAPRRAAWVRVAPEASISGQNEAAFFTLRPETPSIGGFSVVVVEPGTYAFSGGAITSQKPDDPRIVAAEPKKARANAPLLGFVQKGQITQAPVVRESYTSYREYPSYGMGLGFGRSYGGYYGHRHGYWGPRNWFGMSYFPSYPSTTVQRIEKRGGAQQTTYTLSLPNDGLRLSRQGSTPEPLVASITLKPGEAVVLDNIYVAGLEGNFAQCPPGKNPCLAEGATFALEEYAPSTTQPLPSFKGGIVENRRVTRGVWLTGAGLDKNLKRDITNSQGTELFRFESL